MNYSLNHKIDEANCMYRVCEGIRKRLLALVEAGGDKLECAGKLVDFYEVVSPRQAKILERYRDEGVIAHLLASLGTHIYIHLGPDENIDFFKLRDFLKAEWAEVDREVFEEKKTSYFTIGGKELVIDPSSGLLLEKAKPHHNLGKLYAYHSALVDMCQRSDIVISDEFLDWDDFRKWAEQNGYKDGLRLERKVTELGFVPSNVSWQQRSFLPRVMQRLDIDASKPVEHPYATGLDPDLKFPANFTPVDADDTRLAFAWGHLVLTNPDIHEPWKDFEVFRKWALGNGYKSGMMLVKKDQALGLSPDNCNFITPVRSV